MNADLQSSRETIEIYHQASMALDEDAAWLFDRAFRAGEIERGYDPDE